MKFSLEISWAKRENFKFRPRARRAFKGGGAQVAGSAHHHHFSRRRRPVFIVVGCALFLGGCDFLLPPLLPALLCSLFLSGGAVLESFVVGVEDAFQGLFAQLAHCKRRKKRKKVGPFKKKQRQGGEDLNGCATVGLITRGAAAAAAAGIVHGNAASHSLVQQR
jgi:hypothetical protein